jgi:hypothetical protein
MSEQANRAGLPDLDHLRSLPDGSLTQAEVRWLLDEIERLRDQRDAYKEANERNGVFIRG